jgi:hypothetical protein
VPPDPPRRTESSPALFSPRRDAGERMTTLDRGSAGFYPGHHDDHRLPDLRCATLKRGWRVVSRLPRAHQRGEAV